MNMNVKFSTTKKFLENHLALSHLGVHPSVGPPTPAKKLRINKLAKIRDEMIVKV